MGDFVRSLGWGRLVCPHRAGRERLRRVSLREMNMRSKQGRGALLGLIVTSLLLGTLASPGQAQGPRVSRGRHGYALGYRRGYPGGGWGLYPDLTTHRGRDITRAAATMAGASTANRGAIRIPAAISLATGPTSAPATTGQGSATRAMADSAAELCEATPSDAPATESRNAPAITRVFFLPRPPRVVYA